MNLKSASFLLFVAFLFCFEVGCKQPSVFPISKMCLESGAPGPNTVRYACTGIGRNYAEARIDAKKAAMYQIIKNNLRSKEARFKFADHSREFYLRHMTFVKDTKPQGTFVLGDDGNARLKVIVIVDRKQIMTWLKDRGVLNIEKIRDMIGNPTVAVKARIKVYNRQLSSHVSGSAIKFLTSRTYNAMDIDNFSAKSSITAADQTKLLRIKGIKMNAVQLKASLIGADVYFEVAASPQTISGGVKGSANIKAYETTTRKLIGAGTGYGKQYATFQPKVKLMTIGEAIENAMQKTLAQVTNYWQKYAREGSPFKLTIMGKLDAVEDMADYIALAIKRAKGVLAFKNVTSTPYMLTVTFKSKVRDATELMLDLKQRIRSVRGVTRLTTPIKTRKFALFVINKPSLKKAIKDSDSLPADIP